MEPLKTDDFSEIGKIVHTEIGGTLSAMRMEIHYLADEQKIYTRPSQNLYRTVNNQNSRTPVTPAEKSVEHILDLLDKAFNSVNEVLVRLSALKHTETSFMSSVRREISLIQNISPIKCRARCSAFVGPLDETVVTIVLRAIRKTLKHITNTSSATTIEIEVINNETGFELIIMDNDKRDMPEIMIEHAAYDMISVIELAKHLNGQAVIGMSESLGGMKLHFSFPHASL